MIEGEGPNRTGPDTPVFSQGLTLSFFSDMMKPVLVSVVVPVYNSEGSLPLLVDGLSQVLGSGGPLGELILVNDGSHDRSWDVVQSLAAQYSWVRGFNLMRNYGQHNALLCGIRAARYAIIV